MLGWEVFVYRPATPDICIARWMTGMFGLSWIDQLVKDHRAIALGGDGYPSKFGVTAGVLLPIIKARLPANDSPLVIGDDYVLPEGWSGEVKWNKKEVLACQGGDQLVIDAWDQS